MGSISFRFQDIYVPDGALTGHVDPPPPIQAAFQQGWFRLRDSDWEPDWPTTAKTIRWFFEKGNEISPDILITLNLATIEKIISIIGAVDVPEFNFQLNSANLYSLLQNEAENGFFPGSTQKRDALTLVGEAVIKKMASLSSMQYLEIIRLLLQTANQQNILLNSSNTQIQKLFEDKKWTGKLAVPECHTDNCLNDTVLLVETNLGANKANCCVERKTVHTISRSETDINHLINLTLTNSSPSENPAPPRFFGGNYTSYLRYYIPENATNIRLTAQPTLPKTLLRYPAPYDGIKVKTFTRRFVYGLTELGFFHLTAAGTKSAVQLSYDLPFRNLGGSTPINYQLTLLKQNGLESSPQEINLLGKIFTTTLDTKFSQTSSLK